MGHPMENLDIQIIVGDHPFSRKKCLTLQIKGSSRILARFDSPKCMEAFLALRPAYRVDGVDLEALRRILTDGE